MPEDPYIVMSLDRSATAQDVRQAYFRLVRQYTPEAHPEEFQRIRAAYETLRSPLRRAELALLAFDSTVAEVDLDLIADAANKEGFDVVALLLAVELSVSDFARSDYPEDLTPVREEDLLSS